METKNSPRYATYIKEYEISPPVFDEYGYGAKAVIRDRQSSSDATLHEHWGRTSREAYQKAFQEMNEWLAANADDAESIE